MRARPKRQTVRVQAIAEGSRRVEAALREQQRLLGATAARLETADGADIHHGRVAARRLRSLLKTFRPLLDVRRGRLMRTDLRSFARALAAAREADVRRDLLVSLSRRDPCIAPLDFQRLSVKLEDLCLEARATLRRHAGEPGWAALCDALRDDAVLGHILVRRDAELAELLRLVDDSWRKSVRLLAKAPEEAAQLHELRLALKHCRYALEPVADVRPKATARLLRRVRVAQDAIGEHRDTVLADHWVRLNERSLGGHVSGRLTGLLKRQEKYRRKRAAARAGDVLVAYREWRKATGPLRKETKKARASPGRAPPSSARS
jgi:CHAD domain-containing protein